MSDDQVTAVENPVIQSEVAPGDATPRPVGNDTVSSPTGVAPLGPVAEGTRHTADVAVLQTHLDTQAAAGTLTPEMEADIRAHVDQIRENTHDGPVGLGEQMKEPAMAQGAVATAIRLGHKRRALQALSDAQTAVRQVIDALGSAASDDVAEALGTLGFCLDRLAHEEKTISRRV